MISCVNRQADDDNDDDTLPEIREPFHISEEEQMM